MVPAGTGIMTFLTVSPVTRFAVNAPWLDVPVVVSNPADAPFTVRCVLPFASPVIVCELDSSTTLLLLSRRVAVPVTFTVVTAVLVVLSGFDCATPAAVVYFAVVVIVKPSRVVFGPHVTTLFAKAHAVESRRNNPPGPSPMNGPKSPPPMSPSPKPGP